MTKIPVFKTIQFWGFQSRQLSSSEPVLTFTFIIRIIVDFNLHQAWKAFEFWCEGVLFSAIGLFGLLTNFTSFATFLSADLRTQVMVMMTVMTMSMMKGIMMKIMLMVIMMLLVMRVMMIIMVMTMMMMVMMIIMMMVMMMIVLQTFNQLLAVLAAYNIL